MQKSIQNLFNFVKDNFGKDSTVIGLSGLRKKTEYVYVTIPKSYKKTYITNTQNNYLLF